jgi:hypothetical protein
MNHLVVVYDGDLSKDIAEQLISKQPASSIQVSLRSASDKPKGLVSDYSQSAFATVICFIIQTIENASPTEDVSKRSLFYSKHIPNKSLL